LYLLVKNRISTNNIIFDEFRPGRFDVEVTVPTPDFSGRKEIIAHYLGKILSKDINVDVLARGTTGFTGADIENMINQGALKAAIEGAEVVTMRHLENARDKVLMGPERKARLPDEEANKITGIYKDFTRMKIY
jgi:ATP-dependent metalloprotease